MCARAHLEGVGLGEGALAEAEARLPDELSEHLETNQVRVVDRAQLENVPCIVFDALNLVEHGDVVRDQRLFVAIELGLHLGDGVTVEDGQLFLVVDGAGKQPVPPETLDELEFRGWIDTATEPPSITQAGRYWLDRWMKAKYGKGRMVRA